MYTQTHLGRELYVVTTVTRPNRHDMQTSRMQNELSTIHELDESETSLWGRDESTVRCRLLFELMTVSLVCHLVRLSHIYVFLIPRIQYQCIHHQDWCNK